MHTMSSYTGLPLGIKDENSYLHSRIWICTHKSSKPQRSRQNKIGPMHTTYLCAIIVEFIGKSVFAIMRQCSPVCASVR